MAKLYESMKKFEINPDISRAETLPSDFYRSVEVWEALRERIFWRAWHWLGGAELVPEPNFAYPFELLPEFLPEPLVLARDNEGQVACFSNVCTHRGNILVEKAGPMRRMRCAYHGRRFGMGGGYEGMMGFEGAEGFPRACEDLPKLKFYAWEQFFLASAAPIYSLVPTMEAISARVGFLGLENLTFAPERNRDFDVDAHWALYCDNYLEGFHIPFVHPDLNAALDFDSYETVCEGHYVLQIGYAKGDEDIFDLPTGHPDFGKRVAAYYYWIFPNIMLNFYPWGLSVNVVKPLSPSRTRVEFRSYVADASKLGQGAGGDLDKVELEDEAVVATVQKGLQSRLYQTGRFSPKYEKGVHHFHQLLAQYLG